MHNRGTGFGGILSIDGTLKSRSSDTNEDVDFISGKATRLGNLCYDQESCGGNIFIPMTSGISFTPKESGWLYFDTLNFKANSRTKLPWESITKLNGNIYQSTFSAVLEFPSLDFAKKTLAETVWDSNGEPK